MKERSRSCAGFTLIELLVAFIMLMLIGGVALQAVQGGLTQLSRSDMHTQAVYLAQSKLSELSAFEQLTPGKNKGTFENGYTWQTTIKPFKPAPPSIYQPLHVSVDVSNNSQSLFSLSTLMLSRR